MKYKLLDLLTEYKETNKDSLYEPVAVGKYGIRKRNEIYKKELSDDYSKNKVIRDNTLIVGMGSNQIDIGVLSDDEIYSVSPAYHTYRINIQVVDSDYLDLLFKANNANYFRKYSIATARQGKKIDLKSLLNEIVDIPSFEEQDIIVGKIFDINELIRIEEKSLSLLDELTKSRFIELFGNIIDNDRCWNTSKLNEVCDVRDGTHDSPKYVSEGYPFVTSKNITNGELDFSNVQYISKVDYLHFEERSHVDDGDILMPMIGTVGGAVIVKKDREFSIKNVCLIKFSKTNNVLNTYIKYVLNSDEMNLYFDSLKKGGNQPFIGLNTIRSLMIPIPPKNVQYDFVSFVNQVDKLKF